MSEQKQQTEAARGGSALTAELGGWIDAKDRLPEHGEWVLAVYSGVHSPRYVRFWRDAGKYPHFGGPYSDTDGKGSQPATHWMRIPEVPNVALRGEPLAASPSRKRGSTSGGANG